MIALVLVAAVALGVAILPTHRADMHTMHATDCPECES